MLVTLLYSILVRCLKVCFSQQFYFFRQNLQLNTYVAMKLLVLFLYSLQAGMTFLSYLTKLKETDFLEIRASLWFFPYMDLCLLLINVKYLIGHPLIKGKLITFHQFMDVSLSFLFHIYTFIRMIFVIEVIIFSLYVF